MKKELQREYSRTPVSRTLKGNEKQFKLARNSSYRGKFQYNFDQGKENFVRVSGELVRVILVRVIEVLLYFVQNRSHI